MPIVPTTWVLYRLLGLVKTIQKLQNYFLNVFGIIFLFLFGIVFHKGNLSLMKHMFYKVNGLRLSSPPIRQFYYFKDLSSRGDSVNVFSINS